MNYLPKKKALPLPSFLLYLLTSGLVRKGQTQERNSFLPEPAGISHISVSTYPPKVMRHKW
jgi:hypothetical protein